MTVGQFSIAGPYTGSGLTGPFAFNFKIFAETDLEVTKTTIATEEEAVLTLTTDYTVSFGATSGEVTTVAAVAATHTITIRRKMTFTQMTDLRNQGGFFPEVHERVFDRIEMKLQELKEEVGRSVKVNISSGHNPDEFLDDIVSAVAQAAASASSAADSATSAASSVTSAASSAAAAASSVASAASAVASSATAAASSASAAASSASAAASSVTSAASSAAAAASSVTSAASSATAAASSVTSAASSAAAAASSVTSAASSATAAASSVTSAASSATAAASSVTSAASSATAAVSSATAAASSASAAAAAAGNVKVSSNDTTPGYLEAKLLVSTGLSLATQNDGANETRTVSMTGTVPMLAAVSAVSSVSGLVATRTASASQTFSELVYLASSGKMAKANASTVATVPVVAMLAVASAAADASSASYLTYGFARNDAWGWTPGVALYLSASTSGAVTSAVASATDQVVQKVGHAIASNIILFNPSPDYITRV